MNIAEYVAMNSTKPVLVFSLEMPKDAIMLRTLSSFSRVDQSAIRSGKIQDHDWTKLFSSMSLISERMNMYIDDTPALSPSEMRSRARRVARENGGLSMIVVDYLQLMQVPGSKEGRTNEVSEISRNLKALAKELGVPVIALSQLSRKNEERQDKRPMLSDLRESGAIEQDADLIMFVYRDEVYNPDSQDKGTAEIIIGKHRNGPIGMVRLTFSGQFCRFDDYAPQRMGAY
jgi:replicative DNA helicase